MDVPQLVPAAGQPIGVRQIGQQVAAVQLGGGPQRRLVTGAQRGRGRPLELQHIDLHRARVVQHDLFIPDGQQTVGWRPDAGEGAARHVQRLMEVAGGGRPAPGRATAGPAPAPGARR